MRRNWLARAAITATAISVPVAGIVTATGAQAATLDGSQLNSIPIKTHHHHKIYIGRHRRGKPTFDAKAAAYVKKFEGTPYLYGGTTPAGFDCSGLTQYVYRHFGKHIRRTAEDQFLEFRMLSHRAARPGDLVFFHDSSDPNSWVYHVGVYEGGNNMVAATTAGSDVQFQNFSWAGDTVTFGTITH